MRGAGLITENGSERVDVEHGPVMKGSVDCEEGVELRRLTSPSSMCSTRKH